MCYQTGQSISESETVSRNIPHRKMPKICNLRQSAEICRKLRRVAANCGKLRRVAAIIQYNPNPIRIRIRIRKARPRRARITAFTDGCSSPQTNMHALSQTSAKARQSAALPTSTNLRNPAGTRTSGRTGILSSGVAIETAGDCPQNVPSTRQQRKMRSIANTTRRCRRWRRRRWSER